MALPPFPSQLHPVLNHIPIVLLPLAALLATMGRSKDWAWHASKVVLLIAAAGAILTVLTGLSWAGAMRDLPAARAAILDTHRLLGLVTATVSVLLAALQLWKKDALRAGTWSLLWPALLWAATLLVLATAWYGGSLVFERPAGFGGGNFRGGFRGNGTAAPPA